ncbi:MAG: hypothetical protein PF637_07030 [Spirochaetes bacterium]|nr:hypothetical protein [Spirochaetota bacterium]
MENISGINDIELSILLEADYYSDSIINVVNYVWYSNRDIPRQQLYQYASTIISSMVAENKITLRMALYKENSPDGESCTYISDRMLTPEEKELVFKRPDLWDERDIFSHTDMIQLLITDTGRKALAVL